MATNITALAYISRDISSSRHVFVNGGLYTLGRTLTYGVLGVALMAAGLQIGRLSNRLQTFADFVLGPLLILVGLVLLDVIHPTVRVGSVWMERMSTRIAHWGYVGAFLLGALFALAFCPYSAALYFGVLVPLSFKSTGGSSFPLLFGVGTSLPVIAVGLPLALGLRRFAGSVDMLARVGRVMNKVAALAFMGVGIYLTA